MFLTAEQKRQQLPKVYGVLPWYRLRWKFEFLDGKVRTGIWDGAGDRIEDMAAVVNKTGLSRAVIEGEAFHDGYAIRPLFQCDGHMYAMARWRSVCPLPAFLPNGKKYTSTGRVIGLQFLLANGNKVTVYKDGQTKTEPMTESEKRFANFEHRLGAG